jgi:hypothetical protein
MLLYFLSSLFFSRQPIPVVEVFPDMEIGMERFHCWLAAAYRGMPPQRSR